MNSSSDSLSIFAASSGDPRLADAFRETVREGNRMLLKERKLGDPRIDNGCKELARSMVMGDNGTAAIDATDGRRAICIPKPKPSGGSGRTTK